MDWQEVRNSDTYKSAGLMKRFSIRKSYFNDFIKTREDLPPDPIDQAALEYGFTQGFGDEPDLPPPPKTKTSDEEIWNGESPTTYTLKAGAFGAAHSLASALETASFGLSKKVGLGKEGVEGILKEKYEATPTSLTVSDVAGGFAGYG